MLVLTSVLFLTAYTDRTMHHVLKMTAAVPCVYFGVLNLFDWMKVNFPGQIIPFNLDYLLFDILPLSPQSVSYSPNQWFSTALALFIYILTGILIFSLLNEKDGLCMGLLYGAAFAVIAVIGFTVTGRVSGARTTFIPAVLLITVLLKMSANLIKEYVS